MNDLATASDWVSTRLRDKRWGLEGRKAAVRVPSAARENASVQTATEEG
jgi:hypothetical protein